MVSGLRTPLIAAIVALAIGIGASTAAQQADVGEARGAASGSDLHRRRRRRRRAGRQRARSRSGRCIEEPLTAKSPSGNHWRHPTQQSCRGDLDWSQDKQAEVHSHIAPGRDRAIPWRAVRHSRCRSGGRRHGRCVPRQQHASGAPRPAVPTTLDAADARLLEAARLAVRTITLKPDVRLTADARLRQCAPRVEDRDRDARGESSSRRARNRAREPFRDRSTRIAAGRRDV